MPTQIDEIAENTFKSRWLRSFSSEATHCGYRKDIEKFELFLRAENNTNGIFTLAGFLASDTVQANRTVVDWICGQRRAGLASETINRAFTALRSLLKYARTNDAAAPRIAVKQERVRPYRDTVGCGLDGFRSLLSAARRHVNERKVARDAAILMLLFLQGLRRAEVVALNIGDFNKKAATLIITGKGMSEPERLYLCDDAAEAIAAWLAHRECDDPRTALFVGFRRGSAAGRLTGRRPL